MTAAQWFVAGLFVLAVAFLTWVWAMNRLDERRNRRERDQLRQGGPLVLGGAVQPPPRHRAKRSRRTDR